VLRQRHERGLADVPPRDGKVSRLPDAEVDPFYLGEVRGRREAKVEILDPL
jgi:hypothetical protein